VRGFDDGCAAYIAWRAGDALVAGLASRRSARRSLLRLELPARPDLPGRQRRLPARFAAVELGFALIRRHPAVSPLAPLVLIAYPVLETVFSMYRRRIVRGLPVSQPDRIHLHSLIYRRLTRSAAGCPAKQRAGGPTRRPRPTCGAGIALHRADGRLVGRHAHAGDDAGRLRRGLSVAVSAIVRFRTPRWLLRIAKARIRRGRRIDVAPRPARSSRSAAGFLTPTAAAAPR